MTFYKVRGLYHNGEASGIEVFEDLQEALDYFDELVIEYGEENEDFDMYERVFMNVCDTEGRPVQDIKSFVF